MFKYDCLSCLYKFVFHAERVRLSCLANILCKCATFVLHRIAVLQCHNLAMYIYVCVCDFVNSKRDNKKGFLIMLLGMFVCVL